MSLDVYLKDDNGYFYDANITHNLIDMAEAANLYMPLWRPEEIGAKKARDLIVPIIRGLMDLVLDPIKFRALNPENGWGTYDGLVMFSINYLEACMRSPGADIVVSR